MRKRLLDAGSMGSIINTWKRLVRVVNNSTVSLHWLSVKSIVARSVSTNIAKYLFGIKDLKEFIYHQILNLRKDKLLGTRDFGMNNLQAGREIMLDTQVFTIGWNGNLESLGYVNNAELNGLKNTTGLIRVEATKGIYQTGSVFA